MNSGNFSVDQTSGQNSLFEAIVQEIKNTLRTEPHTFKEIRDLIDEARINEVAFFDILQRHHRFLNESIMFLIDRDSSDAEKQIHLDRFIRLFEMHAQAEEETLYRSLLRHSDHEAHRAGLVGQDEHDIAFQLIADLKQSGYLQNWTDDVDAKAQVLANLVASHHFEEEGVTFAAAKKFLPSAEIGVLAGDYLDICEEKIDGGARRLGPNYLNWPMES